MAKSPQNGTVTATATLNTWTKVTAFGDGYNFNHIMITNAADGDIEVAFEATDYPDVRILQGSDTIMDFILAKSPIWVRSVTGTVGGSVYLRVWSSDDQ
jgi:hypothetical protein